MTYCNLYFLKILFYVLFSKYEYNFDMNFLLFATIFLTVFSLMSLYINKRFINKLDIKKDYKIALKLVLILNLLGVLAYVLFRHYPVVPNFIYFIFSIPIGIIFILFTTTVFYELFSFLLKVGVKNTKRREFFKKSLDIGAVSVAVTINAKAMYNAKNIQTQEVQIKLKNLKKEYKIVQLSDVHIGGLIDKEFITSLVKRVNSYQADLVVITGDLIDTKIEYAKEAVNELQNLKSTYGTFFVVGNHEYFHNIEVLMDYLSSLGIKVLQNENYYIGEKNGGFNLAGVYDVHGYRVGAYKPDIKKALQNLNSTSPTILLAHQPKFIYEVPKEVDLVLSGHTHGGQIFPFNLLVKLDQPYVKGLHQHNEHTQIYINKGTGFWGPPMRLGASSEITIIYLEKA